MCLGPEQEPTRAMSEELAAVCLCRQQAERLLGVAAGKHGKVLVTVQGDGVITYSAAQEVSCRQHQMAAVAASSAVCAGLSVHAIINNLHHYPLACRLWDTQEPLDQAKPGCWHQCSSWTTAL